MKRGDLVHTPDGWGMVRYHQDLVTDDVCTGRQIVVRGYVVTVELPDGSDDPWPRWYRRDELEELVGIVEYRP